MDLHPDNILNLTWASEAPVGCVRVSQHHWRSAKRGEFICHTHQFAEFMWIEQGTAEHRINGHTESIPTHGYRCIRPHDVHLVQALPAEDCRMVNISFELGPLSGLAERYGVDWLWPTEGEPRGGMLTATTRERLSAWLEILASPAPRRLDLESFLVDLTRMLSTATGGARSTNLPPWLANVLDDFADPRRMAGGVPELARLCGRSPEHLNRIVRRCQARRATDLVNAIRMEWVAAQLHISEHSIEDLAAACGLANLAHFYRLFHAAYGTTPAQWRRQLRQEMPLDRPLNMAPWAKRK